MSRNISMEEAREFAKKGPFKTLLQQDDRYSEHRPVVIAFVKNGTKYIHGVICHRNDEGVIEPHYYVSEFDKSKLIGIHEGQRWDIIDKYHEWYAAKHRHQEERKSAEREIEYREMLAARSKVSAQMATWDKANPAPRNPFKGDDPEAKAQ